MILQTACPAQAFQRGAEFVHGRELLASNPDQKNQQNEDKQVFFC